MKACKHCGTQVGDEVIFCFKCGEKVEHTNSEPQNSPNAVAPNPNNQADSKKNKSATSTFKIMIAAVCSVALVAVICGTIWFFQWYHSDAQILIRKLDSGEYELAVEMVEQNTELRTSNEVSEKLKNRLDNLLADFKSRNIDYSAATLELSTIEQLNVADVTEKLHEVSVNITRLNTSRTNFSSAEALFADQNYAEAMTFFANVIEDDDNYELSRARYDECVENYRKDVLANAGLHAAKGDYSSALVILNGALNVLPNDSKITEQINAYSIALGNQLKADTIEKAELHASKQDYVSAIQVIAEYVTAYGEDAEITIKYNEYIAAYEKKVKEETLNTAAAYANQEKYAEAMDMLSAYLESHASDTDVNQAYCTYYDLYVSVVLDKAQSQLSDNHYEEALKILNDGLKIAKDDTKLLSALATYQETYINTVLKSANDALDSEQYNDALQLVRTALKVVPNNKSLLDMEVKILASTPKLLLDVCKPYGTSRYSSYTGGNYFTMSGKNWTNGFTLNGSDGCVYFTLDRAYEVLEFYSGHTDGDPMRDAVITVYIDGIQYNAYNIKATDIPRKISIDVKGAEQIKFEIYTTGSAGWYDPDYGFAEVTVK